MYNLYIHYISEEDTDTDIINQQSEDTMEEVFDDETIRSDAEQLRPSHATPNDIEDLIENTDNSRSRYGSSGIACSRYCEKKSPMLITI